MFKWALYGRVCAYTSVFLLHAYCVHDVMFFPRLFPPLSLSYPSHPLSHPIYTHLTSSLPLSHPSLILLCILQMLYFNLNERPKELFDKIVQIKVLNSKVLILESLIGSFKFDVGMVYDEPGAGEAIVYIHVHVITYLDSYCVHVNPLMLSTLCAN